VLAHFLTLLFDLEDGDNNFLQNIDKLLPGFDITAKM
jgi:hypothetical protein